VISDVTQSTRVTSREIEATRGVQAGSSLSSPLIDVATGSSGLALARNSKGPGIHVLVSSAIQRPLRKTSLVPAASPPLFGPIISTHTTQEVCDDARR
jgi:hypothetical protein